MTALPAEALGPVFGRDHVVHVAVAPGRLADAIAVEAGAACRGCAGDLEVGEDRVGIRRNEWLPGIARADGANGR